MENLSPEVASVFKVVASGNRTQVHQAVSSKKYPDDTNHRGIYIGDRHLYSLMHRSDSAGRNLLHYACMYNTDDVASWIASLSTQYCCNNQLASTVRFARNADKHGITAGMYAARAGLQNVIKELIQPRHETNKTEPKHKVNEVVQVVDNQGRNLLHYCFGEGEQVPVVHESRQTECTEDDRAQIVKYLIEKGINFCHKDASGRNPLQCAAQKDYDEHIKYITGDYSRAKQIWGKKDLETVAMLSERLIHPRICLSITPLEKECYIQEPNLLAYNTRDKPHVNLERKPLKLVSGYMHLCVKDCFTGDLKYDENMGIFESTIVKGKLNVNEVDENGMTALHYLCYYKFVTEPYGIREGAIAKLLELGADPHIEDIRGYTPLMCAVEKGFIDMYDLSDPRTKNGKDIGNLLNASIKIQNVLSLNTAADSAGGDHKAGLCVNNCPEQIRKMNIRIDNIEEDQTHFRDQQRKVVMNLTQSELGCSEKQEICSKKLEMMEQETSALKQKQDRDLQVMTEKINNLEGHYENKIKELQTEYEGRFDAIKESNDHLYNTVVELQQDVQAKNQKIELLEDQLNIIKVQNEKASKADENPSNSLLLSNLVLNDVCRYLDSGVEVSCMSEAKLDELQATVEKDEQKYKTIYLVMAHQGIESIQEVKESWVKLVQASKGKAMSVIVSSILPTIDEEEVNNKIKQLNKCLEEVCYEQHVQFVNNDITFKRMNEATNDEYFEENSDILSALGIKRLLKNLGLLKIRKKAQVTNI